MTTKPGPFINITTSDGELLQRIDLSGYDLSKPFARADLLAEICREVQAYAQRVNDAAPSEDALLSPPTVLDNDPAAVGPARCAVCDEPVSRTKRDCACTRAAEHIEGVATTLVRTPILLDAGGKSREELDKADAAGVLKWSSPDSPPRVGAILNVRQDFQGKGPLGKVRVIGYVVEYGWLYLAVATKKRGLRPLSPQLRGVTLVAGIDLTVT